MTRLLENLRKSIGEAAPEKANCVTDLVPSPVSGVPRGLYCACNEISDDPKGRQQKSSEERERIKQQHGGPRTENRRPTRAREAA